MDQEEGATRRGAEAREAEAARTEKVGAAHVEGQALAP